mmetsp:Transcript_27289/g.62944  ORF Transcript_27289/g.62944 Transcript_27289/m.62944 type:complete len:446 (-) Transcript_27289:407-1744(-)
MALRGSHSFMWQNHFCGSESTETNDGNLRHFLHLSHATQGSCTSSACCLRERLPTRRSSFCWCFAALPRAATSASLSLSAVSLGAGPRGCTPFGPLGCFAGLASTGGGGATAVGPSCGVPWAEGAATSSVPSARAEERKLRLRRLACTSSGSCSSSSPSSSSSSPSSRLRLADVSLSSISTSPSASAGGVAGRGGGFFLCETFCATAASFGGASFWASSSAGTRFSSGASATADGIGAGSFAGLSASSSSSIAVAGPWAEDAGSTSTMATSDCSGRDSEATEPASSLFVLSLCSGLCSGLWSRSLSLSLSLCSLSLCSFSLCSLSPFSLCSRSPRSLCSRSLCSLSLSLCSLLCSPLSCDRCFLSCLARFLDFFSSLSLSRFSSLRLSSLSRLSSFLERFFSSLTRFASLSRSFSLSFASRESRSSRSSLSSSAPDFSCLCLRLS